MLHNKKQIHQVVVPTGVRVLTKTCSLPKRLHC